MTLMIPGPLQGLASVVVGADWPEADEDSLWRLQEAWDAAAQQVGQVADLTGDAATRVLAEVDGDVAAAFADFVGTTTGPDGILEALRSLMDQQGARCDEFALQTEHAKLSIIAALIALAAEIAALIASSVATFGAASAGIPVAQLATQLTVRKILQELVMETLQGALVNAGTELAVQTVQAVEHGTRAYDGGAVLGTAADGAVAGATGAMTGTASKGLFGTTSTSFVGSAARGGAEGAFAGAYANAVNGVRNDGSFDGGDLLSGGLSGGVSGSRGGTADRLDGLSQTYSTQFGAEFGLGRDGGLLTGGQAGLTDPSAAGPAPQGPPSGPAPSGPAPVGPTPGAPAPTPAPGAAAPKGPAPAPAPAPPVQPGYSGWSYADAARLDGRVPARPDAVDDRPGA